MKIPFLVVISTFCLLLACTKRQTTTQITEIQPVDTDTVYKTNVVLKDSAKIKVEIQSYESLQVGANQLLNYIPVLSNQRVGLVVNHTSLLNKTHLVDTLLGLGIPVKKIFAPEHGFRGDADAGETVKNSRDVKTGLPLISLYGSNKKPTVEQLADLDVVVFDIQDVGARFYTYISTMHYVMEACAENGKKVIILDRPNPNGNYVDGCVLDMKFQSFVGMHPVPVVHGLTVGELTMMINGEGWLKNSIKCDLQVIKVENYRHSDSYSLPVKPSPNLPNDLSIILYPSLCLFEGTIMSVGRGTTYPFQVVGYPDKRMGTASFTPKSIVGMSKNPPFENQTCYGVDFRNQDIKRGFSLSYLIDFYEKAPDKTKFFNSFFDKLAGTDQLRKQIQSGMNEQDIRKTWETDLKKYRSLRKKYLLYEE